jgi:hypothetical protein
MRITSIYSLGRAHASSFLRVKEDIYLGGDVPVLDQLVMIMTLDLSSGCCLMVVGFRYVPGVDIR